MNWSSAKLRIISITATLCIAPVGPLQAAATFTPIGIFPGGIHPVAIGEAVSADGNVVLGGGWTSVGVEPFRWTEEGGLVALGEVPGGLNETFLAGRSGGVFARTSSADGSVVVGGAGSSNGFEAFRWTEATGMVALGDLPGGRFAASTTGVSADGSILVGNGASTNGDEAFRWTEATGMVGLGDLPGGDYASYAANVSADGSVIVGYSISANGSEAFRWTQATGMVGLGALPGHSDSQTNAVSADGSVIGGISGGDDGTGNFVAEAFRWTQEGGMVGLGGGAWEPLFISADGSVIVGWTFPLGPGDVQAGRYWSQATGTIELGTLPGGSRTIALGASADGSVVVGQVEVPNGAHKAFYWTKETGILDLRDLLINEGVTNLAGWNLNEARAVSADGRTIVGNSVNRPGADFIPWVARLSAPTLAGDFNEDGTVDAADYVVWRHGHGTTYTQNDYDLWRANFGKTAGSGAAGYPLGASAQPLSANVPEPSSLVLATAVLLAVAFAGRTKAT